MLIGDPASDDWPLAIAEYRAVAAEQASDVLQDEVYGPCESGSAEAEELHEAEELQVVVQCLGNAYSNIEKGDVYRAKSVYLPIWIDQATTR